ncbi:hypothetical protein PCANC_01776 [Puccinia coronata f. sp. avenae]|uniref:Uncharacterized protein n=1 Tax=Puccinia coronata f. sp. avenae TaxID=200324 RepID=A0A2N5W563_9BASI|nr:hypothetical protein PCANC_01776 [Puccinia coronata f. sp. avenae]
MSNKPGLMGLSNMGLDDCVRSPVKQPGSMSFSNMGFNRLFDPMLDNIYLMSFYSSDRLFDSLKSVAEQASDLLGKLFPQQGNDLLVKELGEQANNLLAKR